MANVQDATQGITISVIAQGLAHLTSFTVNPLSGVSGNLITVTPIIYNNGATDTLWRRMYVNGSLANTTSLSVNTGAQWSPNPTYQFNLTQTSTVYCTVGHMLGSNYILDETSSTITVTMLTYAHAAFEGTPTYQNSVDPGTTVTITYPVRNTGGAGLIWGGLYDNSVPPVLIAGTLWTTSSPVAAGALVSPTPTTVIIVDAPFTGQLIIGHVE